MRTRLKNAGFGILVRVALSYISGVRILTLQCLSVFVGVKRAFNRDYYPLIWNRFEWCKIVYRTLLDILSDRVIDVVSCETVTSAGI